MNTHRSTVALTISMVLLVSARLTLAGNPPVVAARPLAEDSLGVVCTVDDDCAGSAYCMPDANGAFPGGCYAPKSRYVSFDPNPVNTGIATARRISLETVGGPVVLGWLAQPFVVDPPLEDPILVSRIVDAPFYADWSVIGGTVNLGDCQIQPGPVEANTYIIQAISQGADESSEGSYSVGLLLQTTDLFADINGDGEVTVNDHYRALAGFWEGVEDIVEPWTWFDLDPEVPDMHVTLAEAYLTWHAFDDPSYPYRTPLECPVRSALCGDGILDLGEGCDDGNTTMGDGCGTYCQTDGPTTATLQLVPVRASGVECATPDADPTTCDWFLDGNRIVLHGGDQYVDMEVLVSGWASGDFCTATGEACDNSVTYADKTCSGSGGPCFSDQDCKICSDSGEPCEHLSDCVSFSCVSSIGETCDDACSSKFCTDRVTACLDDSDCAIGETCGIDNDCGIDLITVQAGLACESMASGASGVLASELNYCSSAGFVSCTGIDEERSDFVFATCALGGVYADSAWSELDGCPIGSSKLGSSARPPCQGEDDGTIRYVGQFEVHVPADATGTFTVRLDPDPGLTLIRDQFVRPISPIALEPALITLAGDCNNNGVLDHIDILLETSPDCNGNMLPDECDIAASDMDCNFDGIPDECQPAADCNANAVNDICDIALGTSLDCNRNKVPDDCDLNQLASMDLNGDTVPDECEKRPMAENFFATCRVGECALDHSSCSSDEDCFAPVPGITCGAPGSTQFEADQECRFTSPGSNSPMQTFCIRQPAGNFPGECYVSKNRYLSINANPLGAGVITARRVTYEPFSGGPPQLAGWAGPPTELISGAMPPIGFPHEEPNVFVSKLQATPHFMDWNAVGRTVHVTGCGVRPGDGISNLWYSIQSIEMAADLDDESSYSAPLRLPTTAKFGDTNGSMLISGQLSPPDGTVNFLDIFSAVTLFTTTNESVSVLWVDTTPSHSNQFINFQDIFDSIYGFQNGGTGFPYTSEPCDCLDLCTE